MSLNREVAIPDLGADAYVIFGIAEMQTFEDTYGESYVSRIVDGIDRGTLSIMRNCIDVMIKDSNMSADDILNAHSFSTIGAWLLNAISLSLHGKRIDV